MKHLLLLALPLVGFVSPPESSDELPASRAKTGGETSVDLPRAQAAYRGAFSFPAANLSLTRQSRSRRRVAASPRSPTRSWTW